MKKTSINCLLALAVVPVFCMCSKTNEVAQRTQVTITANIEDTKVSLTQGTDKLVLSWEEGDAINIIGTTTEEFTIKSGFTAKSAEFTGNEVTGSNFDIVYPSDYADIDAITARSYAGQVQDGNGSTAHLEYNAIISGAADYKEISFAKGATGVKMNGALKLVVKLPDDVTAVSSLTLTAPSAIFYTTNGTTSTSKSLSMTFTNTAIVDDHTLTAYMMTSWQDVTIPADTKLTLDVTVPEQNSYYSKSFSCATDQTISGGATFVIDISSATLAYTLKGSGTQTDPYLLYTAQDMSVIRNFLNVKEKKYFKMMADIDMADVTGWKVLNDGNDKDGETQFAHEINFNGNNKTIKNFTCGSQAYPSFFGVLIGECYDVTFENATVSQETASSSPGVVGGYVGTGDRGAVLRNVTLKNCAVSIIGTGKSCNAGFVCGNAASSTFENVIVEDDCTLTLPSDYAAKVGGIIGNGSDNKICTLSKCANKANIIAPKAKQIGGIAGRLTGNVSECYNIGSISGAESVAGIVGLMYPGDGSHTYVISNCYSTGDLSNSGQMTGGICGNVCRYVDLKYCYAAGSLNGLRVLGGIAGRLANDGWNGNVEDKGGVNNLISCHVWCPSITHTQSSAGGGSGTVIGYANRWNTYKGCYRAPWYGDNNPDQTALSVANEPNEIPVDQEDCNSSNPITVGIKGTSSARGNLTMEHTWPYHGKVASQEKLTDLVKTLTGDVAWDTDIWDLSGDYPTLKNNPESTL